MNARSFVVNASRAIGSWVAEILPLSPGRGYRPKERERLRALVASAQSVPNLDLDPAEIARAERARTDALKPWQMLSKRD